MPRVKVKKQKDETKETAPLYALITGKEMKKLKRELIKREMKLIDWVREKIKEI